MIVVFDDENGDPLVSVDELMLFFDRTIQALEETLDEMRKNGVVDGTTYLHAMLSQTRFLRGRIVELVDTSSDTVLAARDELYELRDKIFATEGEANGDEA